MAPKVKGKTRHEAKMLMERYGVSYPLAIAALTKGVVIQAEQQAAKIVAVNASTKLGEAFANAVRALLTELPASPKKELRRFGKKIAEPKFEHKPFAELLKNS